MIWHSVQHAARALRARPALTGVSVLSLALGVGANVAIFTVVNAALLRPLPFADASRLIQLANGEAAATLSGPEVVDLQRDSRTLAAIGVYAFADGNVTGGHGDAERVRVARVNAGFFETLAPPLIAGRAFGRTEDRPGGPAVVVVSHALASRYFGRATDALGHPLVLNGVPCVVTGVLPVGFDYPAASVDVWLPLALNEASPGERRNHQYRVVGRLATGATLRTAQAEVDAAVAAWQRQDPATYDPTRPLIATVTSISDRIVGSARPYLWTMLGAAAFVLLIACVNVASLLLTYGEARRTDLAIAIALGATRRRLVTRVLAESAILAAAGGVAGIGIALPACRALVAIAPTAVPRLDDVSPDAAVLGFAVLISVATALASGLVPLVRTLRETDAVLLRSAGRSAGLGGRMTTRLHTALVVAEVALAVTLLGGAGLLTRSLFNLEHTPLGFSPAHVLTARLSLPRAAYSEARAAATIGAMVDQLTRTPTVTSAAAMAWTPILEGGGMWSVMSDALTPRSTAEAPTAAPQQVTPGFFKTLAIPIRRGREFAWSDTAGAQLVGIVNERLARMLWSGTDPLGRRFKVFSPTAAWVTVVGVVPDTRVDGLTEADPPMFYVPYTQASQSAYFTSLSVTLAAAYSGSATPVASAIRGIVRDSDPAVPISDLRGLDDLIGSTIARERFTGLLVAGFAGLAAVLAGIGIYGVIACGVAQRRFEIGVRMALGATAGRILASVAGRGVAMVGVGLTAGLVGVALIGRLLRALLVGVDVLDPLVWGLVVATTLLVAGAALCAPARRAALVDPAAILRR
jgi:putative ABC transport system permease protein